MSLIPLIIFFRLFGKSTLYALAIFTEKPDWKWWVILTVMGFIIPIFFLGHIYQFLWEEPSRNFPPGIPAARSWAEGLWMWFVCLGALAILVVGFLVWYDFNPPRKMLDELGSIFTGDF